MPFSIFGLNISTLMPIIALLAVLFFEFRDTDKRWRIVVVILAIFLSIGVGFLDTKHQEEQALIERLEKLEESKALAEIENGVAPIPEISTNTKDSLVEIKILRKSNADQRAMIGSLVSENQLARNEIVSLNETIASLQNEVGQAAEATENERAAAAEDRKLQIAAANRAAAQAACAASYTVSPDGKSTSTIYPNLSPYGGGTCLNGVYYPPRQVR